MADLRTKREINLKYQLKLFLKMRKFRAQIFKNWKMELPVMAEYPFLPPVGPILAVNSVSPWMMAGFHGLNDSSAVGGAVRGFEHLLAPWLVKSMRILSFGVENNINVMNTFN